MGLMGHKHFFSIVPVAVRVMPEIAYIEFPIFQKVILLFHYVIMVGSHFMSEGGPKNCLIIKMKIVNYRKILGC